jgi:hypothetical protein
VERPSGSPDHHRGLHKHRIRGCGPLLILLSLISYSKLASWYFPRDSQDPICLFAPILGMSPARGPQAPFKMKDPTCYICALILLYFCPRTSIYVSSFCYIFVLILLCMCPHTEASGEKSCIPRTRIQKFSSCE